MDVEDLSSKEIEGFLNREVTKAFLHWLWVMLEEALRFLATMLLLLLSHFSRVRLCATP